MNHELQKQMNDELMFVEKIYGRLLDRLFDDLMSEPDKELDFILAEYQRDVAEIIKKYEK